MMILWAWKNNLEFFSDFDPKNQLDHPCNFTPYWPVMFCLWWRIGGSVAVISTSAHRHTLPRTKLHPLLNTHTLPCSPPHAIYTVRLTCTPKHNNLPTHSHAFTPKKYTYSVTNTSSRHGCVYKQTHIHSPP